jgi:hypothetical protein
MLGRASRGMAASMCSPRKPERLAGESGRVNNAKQDGEMAPEVVGGVGRRGGGTTGHSPGLNAGAIGFLRDEDISRKFEPCTQVLNLLQGELSLSGQEH